MATKQTIVNEFKPPTVHLWYIINVDSFASHLFLSREVGSGAPYGVSLQLPRGHLLVNLGGHRRGEDYNGYTGI